MKHAFNISKPEKMQELLYLLTSITDRSDYIVTVEKTPKARTVQQNNALHAYFTALSINLNDAGLDQRAVFEQMKEGVQIPWSQEAVKENLWKPVQKAITGKDKTSSLTKLEVGEIYEALNRWTAGKLGLSVRFPSEE